ncbi:MAG: T9SS type A sorting domain-containing protein [Bacteroidota bacterium]|nr:T9SS type A sorting domain-containing protein [Bacteroidota bacterium]
MMKKILLIIIILFTLLGNLAAQYKTVRFGNLLVNAQALVLSSLKSPANVYVPHKNKTYAINVENDEVPRSFELYQNYPNPFNPSTLIKYDVAHETFVSLKVFNLLGQEVSVLVNRIQKAGSYSLKFDAAGLNSGFYIYRFQADGFIKVRKMLFLK